MKLKRLLSIFLVLTLWLTLAACGKAETPAADVTTTTSTATTTTTTAGTVTTTTTTTGIGDITIGSVDVTGTIVTPSYIPTTESTATTTTTTTVTTTTTTKATTTATTVSAADKQLVDRAMKLATGEKIESATLTGVVTDIREAYNEGYGNASFDIQVEGTDGAQTIYCYRVKPAEGTAPEVSMGDTVTLTGTIQNYKGTIEFYPATYSKRGTGATTATTATTTRTTGQHAIDEDGIYESKDDVALYLHVYGKLPKNFVTKSEYNSLGKPANKCCGGDRFYNKEGLLPNKAGRLYYECDIDTYGSTSRGAKRLVWTKSGIVYYTGDHYETFTKLYGER